MVSRWKEGEKNKISLPLFFFFYLQQCDCWLSAWKQKFRPSEKKWISKKSWEMPDSTIHTGLERARLLFGMAVAAEIAAKWKKKWCHLLSVFSLLWVDIFRLKLTPHPTPHPPTATTAGILGFGASFHKYIFKCVVINCKLVEFNWTYNIQVYVFLRMWCLATTTWQKIISLVFR